MEDEAATAAARAFFAFESRYGEKFRRSTSAHTLAMLDLCDYDT